MDRQSVKDILLKQALETGKTSQAGLPYTLLHRGQLSNIKDNLSEVHYIRVAVSFQMPRCFQHPKCMQGGTPEDSTL